MIGHFYDVSSTDIFPMLPGRSGPDTTLPASLEGIFWTTNQGTLSKLITFAYDAQEAEFTNCSTKNGTDNVRCVRYSGNKMWSFAGPPHSWTKLEHHIMRAYWACDSAIHYNFVSPTSAMVTVQSCQNTEYCINEELALNSFTTGRMDLLHKPDSTDNPYPGSYVWSYRNDALPTESSAAYAFNQHHVVQVMDRDANKIQPAWNKFMKQEKMNLFNETFIWYTSRQSYPKR